MVRKILARTKEIKTGHTAQYKAPDIYFLQQLKSFYQLLSYHKNVAKPLAAAQLSSAYVNIGLFQLSSGVPIIKHEHFDLILSFSLQKFVLSKLVFAVF